jgi:hypothetical protein
LGTLASSSTGCGKNYIKAIRTLVNPRCGSWLQSEGDDRAVDSLLNLNIFESFTTEFWYTRTKVSGRNFHVKPIATPVGFIIRQS